jgi:broad specificity phosphatase PhoE
MALMFVIVRHGNTFTAGEPPRRIGARTDLPLTEVGHDQARVLGQHFAARHWNFGRVLASPLLRTRQTAEAILAAQPYIVDTETADFLREIDHGPDENQTDDEVIARIGKQALSDWDRYAVPPSGWFVDAATRIAAWQSLFRTPANDQRPTLIVTSNGAARFALLADPALRASLGDLATLKLPTGSYGIIRQASDGSIEVPVWGQRP